MQDKTNNKNAATNKPSSSCSCDFCVHYDWDEDGEYYVCNMELDEDEMLHFLKGNFSNCPYYQPYDEYKIAKKQ